LRIRQAVTPANSEEVLGLLAQADSPLFRVFEAVDHNTVPESAGMGQLQESVTGLFDKVKKGLGIEGAPPGLFLHLKTLRSSRRLGSVISQDRSRRFQSIHYLIAVAKDSKRAPADSFSQRAGRCIKRCGYLAEQRVPGDTKAMAKVSCQVSLTMWSGDEKHRYVPTRSESIEAVSPARGRG
jgi:hypothetical protein